jgi:hypothetical protein
MTRISSRIMFGMCGSASGNINAKSESHNKSGDLPATATTLLPCPFCGSTDIDSRYCDSPEIDSWMVSCDCGAEIHDCDCDRVNAEKAWNRRQSAQDYNTP